MDVGLNVTTLFSSVSDYQPRLELLVLWTIFLNARK